MVHRQRDRQTGRQTDRQAGRQTDRQDGQLNEGHGGRETCRQTEERREIETEIEQGRRQFLEFGSGGFSGGESERDIPFC